MSERGAHIMRRQAIIVAAALLVAPLRVQGADLMVWWEKGFYPQEDRAVREIIAAFEQETGKDVELVQPAYDATYDKALAALDAGRPPDFLLAREEAPVWAYEDQLVDLTGALGSALNLFDADAIEAATLLNGRAGERGLYALPMGRRSNHLHVWRILLEQAGFTLDDVPKEWQAFWSFWCDNVQPAVREATGRDDIWGIGLPMSSAASDTFDQLVQFQLAYGTPWIDRERHLQVDDLEVREGMVRALDSYTAIWRKGCTPPESVGWNNVDNNTAFLAQTVVMTPNTSLSIPGALKREQPAAYYENAATIDWPDDDSGQPLVLVGGILVGVVFKAGSNSALAQEFVRFLAEEGWLAHWLTFAGDRYLPPMRKLVEQPFWLDPSDPHRMRAAIQILTWPHLLDVGVRDDEWRSRQIWQESVWGNAVHRVAAEGISPEQAVDEAIARIKQILAK
jgi:multiple sugar transport system substrate-binding protein